MNELIKEKEELESKIQSLDKEIRMRNQKEAKIWLQKFNDSVKAQQEALEQIKIYDFTRWAKMTGYKTCCGNGMCCDVCQPFDHY